MIVQNLSQKQKLRILPKQIQLLNFFQLNNLELDNRIQLELEENPMLEEVKQEDESLEKKDDENVQDFQDWEEYGYDDIPDYKIENKNYLPETIQNDRPFATSEDFRIALKRQWQLISDSPVALEFGNYIIDSLDEYGMLVEDIERLAEDFAFKKNHWLETHEANAILSQIRQLEPAGIASTDARECMLAQLHKMDARRPDVKKATALLSGYYQELKRMDFARIQSSLDLDEEEFKIVIDLLSGLSLKPMVGEPSENLSQYIKPDYTISFNGEDIEVALINSRSDQFFINNEWKSNMEAMLNSKKDKDAIQYLNNKLQSAQWFISAIKERETNMLKVMRAIVEYQRDYFQSGDINHLRPMVLRNIAGKVGLDISTVSRITSNKYADTPYGVISLKQLFTEGIVNKQGESVSNRVIQKAIEDVISRENKTKPFTDKQLVAVLAEKGFNVARRTVAKYREVLKIPVAQVRAMLS